MSTDASIPRVAGDVAAYVAPVGPHTRCETVADRFSEQPDLFVQPVIDDDGTPLGLLNRFRLLNRLSQRFGRDLLLRRDIVDCLEGPPLVLDEGTPIEHVGSQLFDGDRTHILDGFIVVRGGKYVGVGTGVSLARALSDLTVFRARAAAEEAARANAAKSAFIANVSHEIRTPLNGVIGIADLLRETQLTTDQRELIDLLRVSGDVLLSLVDDVLDYAKIESRRFELDAVRFSPAEVIGQIVKILSLRTRGKSLRIEGHVGAHVPSSVIGDHARLRQVLLNLGGNAIKFTEEGHVRFGVDVKCFARDSVSLEFSVQDTGIGIAADSHNQLFRPFSQVHSVTAKEYGGTGLGLSICREIVEQMGGTIQLTSELGRGSTFFFTIPLAIEQRPEIDQATPQLPTPQVGRSLRILLAEDNPVNQFVAAGLIRKIGCTVVAVANGQAAIDALVESEFDLVLMDCQMPELDGLEATRRIREGAAGASARVIPIVALTANASTDSHASCLDAGMNGYLTKPISFNALQQGLARWR